VRFPAANRIVRLPTAITILLSTRTISRTRIQAAACRPPGGARIMIPAPRGEQGRPVGRVGFRAKQSHGHSARSEAQSRNPPGGRAARNTERRVSARRVPPDLETRKNIQKPSFRPERSAVAESTQRARNRVGLPPGA
jgi:hypothetical protein